MLNQHCWRINEIEKVEILFISAKLGVICLIVYCDSSSSMKKFILLLSFHYENLVNKAEAKKILKTENVLNKNLIMKNKKLYM